MLMSATTSDDVDRLRELMLHSAVDVVATAAATAGDARPNTASGTAAEIEHFRIDCDRYSAYRALPNLDANIAAVLRLIGLIIWLIGIGLRCITVSAISTIHHIPVL